MTASCTVGAFELSPCLDRFVESSTRLFLSDLVLALPFFSVTMPVLPPRAFEALKAGHAGYNLFVDQPEIKEAPLVASLFTAVPSWNAPNILDDSASSIAPLRAEAPFGPPPHGEEPDDWPSHASDLRSTFLGLNAKLLRHSSASRIWSDTERYSLLSQLDYGPSIVLARLSLPNGATTKPMICVCGPMSVTPMVATCPTSLLFPTEETPEIPALVPGHPAPPDLAPIAVSLAANSRAIITAATPRTVMADLHAAARSLICPDGRDFLTAIPVHNKSFHPGVFPSTDDPFAASQLWIPETPSETPSRWVIDNRISSAWSTADSPPDPRSTLNPWDAAPLPKSVTFHRQYHGSKVTIRLTSPPDASSSTQRGGVLLVPKVLLAPRNVQLPIGMVLDPANLEYADFLQLLDAAATDPERPPSSWFSTPLTRMWFEATKQDAPSFTSRLISQETFDTWLNLAPVQPAKDLTLHLPLDRLSQHLWDFAYCKAHASVLPKLEQFAKECLLDAQLPHSPNATPALGYVASVYRHPYLLHARSPSIHNWLAAYKWKVFSPPNDLALPAFIGPIERREITIVNATDVSPVPRTPIFLNLGGPSASKTPLSSPQANPTPGDDDDVDSVASVPLTTFATDDSTPAARTPLRSNLPDSQPPKRKLDDTDFISTLKAAKPKTRSDVPPASPPPLAGKVFNPFAASTPHSTTLRDDPWRLPVNRHDQLPLPDPNPTTDPAIAVARIIAADASAKTAQPDEKQGPADVIFRHATVSQITPTSRVMRKAAFFGASRVHKPVTAHPVAAPKELLPRDYLFLPGSLGPQYQRAFLPAFLKTNNKQAQLDFATWLKRTCQNAQHRAKELGPLCSIDPAFFDQNTVSAIQHLNFLTGKLIRSPTDLSCGGLSAWHFLRSIPAYATQVTPRLPAEGVTAGSIFDILTNIQFILHLPYIDVRYRPFLGQGHSPVSRFSPFIGHLMELAAPFNDRPFQQLWDNKSSNERQKYTKALFHAIDLLFLIMTQWEDETFEADVTFIPAQMPGSAATLCFLNPYVSSQNKSENLVERLKAWRQLIEPFDIERLKLPAPTSGLFLCQTPSCIDSAPTPKPNHEDADSRSDDRRRRNRDNPRNPAQDPGTDRHRSRDPAATPAPSGEFHKARVPLIRCAPGKDFMPVAKYLSQINRRRATRDKIRVPSHRPQPNGNSVQPCFSFCVNGSRGCNRSEAECNFAHMDLADPQRLKANVPNQHFTDLLSFLRHEEVASQFVPTTEFENFVSSL